jgi:hypothetical protein
MKTADVLNPNEFHFWTEAAFAQAHRGMVRSVR